MKLFSTFVAVLVTTVLSAQTHDHDSEHLTCGINDARDRFFDAHPEEEAMAEIAAAALEVETKNYKKNLQKDDEILTIPVVFHIVHFNGPENISNGQIESAVEVLNEDFNAGNPDIFNVSSTFAGFVADVSIEFKLAQLDPNGNCTNGITRTASNQTFMGGDGIKEIAPSWGRESYLNVWICANIGDGVAGYAYLPSSVNGPFGALVDGILIQSEYVGRIGTGSPALSHALSHEVGHWLNLLHTWGNGNQPGLSSNCGGDDNVSDTPNTIGWTSCEIDGVTCGTTDNVENFMDYSYCYKMFSIGQKNRMRAALLSSTAQRNQLTSENNLIETGVNSNPIICEADFSKSINESICEGRSITFSDQSFNGPTTWQWSFPGGTPATSTLENPTVVYETEGDYSVSLSVSNNASSADITKVDFINVIPLGEGQLPFSESFESFSGNDLTDENWYAAGFEGDVVKWELRENVGYTGSKSLYLHGRANSAPTAENLFSPTYDLTGLSENAVLRFKYAHAKRNNQSADQLRVYVSLNCGQTWLVRASYNADQLPTIDNNVGGEFTPTNQEQWREVTIDNLSSIFFNESFRVRFEFESAEGNNIYIDDINIFDSTTLGVDAIDVVRNLNIFPNPTSNSSSIIYTLTESAEIGFDVLDISGRVIQRDVMRRKPAGEHRSEVDLSSYVNGIYFVRLRIDEGSIVRKLIVQ